jgi:hypothetical protein
VNANPQSPDRKQLVWPIAGGVLGFLVAMTPSKTGIPLAAGIVTWCATMLLVLILAAHPIGARVGALLGGLSVALPGFVWASPLARGLLACAMAAPFLAAAALVRVPPIRGFRARLAYLFTWGGTHPVKPCARTLDLGRLQALMISTAVLAAALAGLKAASTHQLGLPVRWLAGGIGLLAIAEMVTAAFPLVGAAFGFTVAPLMQSPYRSASISEFWTKRWNLWASENLFRPYCFDPFARQGVAIALSVAFFASAVGHALLVFLMLGRWGISLSCGAFFMVQPVIIFAERRMNVRRWPLLAARVWTLVILASVSPFFVEPAVQILEMSLGTLTSVLLSTLTVLGFVIVFSVMVSLASLPAAAAPAQLAPQPTSATVSK